MRSVSASSRVLRCVIAAVFILSVPVAPAYAAEPTDAFEPDDTLAAAQSIPLDDTPQLHFYEGDTVGGADWLKFEAAAGNVYRLKVWRDTLWSLPTAAFYGPDQEQVSFDWETHLGDAIEWVFYATETGTHFVELGQPSEFETGTYFVSMLGGTPSSVGLADEYEPDNTLRSAKAIPVDGTIQRRLNDRMDIARFSARAGKTYRVEISWEAEWEYLLYGVFNASGGAVLPTTFGHSEGTRYFKAQTDGDLYVMCNNGGGPFSGPYLLSVTEMDSSILSGTVTRVPDGTPFAGARVTVYKSDITGYISPSDPVAALTSTSASGAWSVALNPGTYCVRYEDPSGVLLGEYHDSVVVAVPRATPIPLGEGQMVTLSGHLFANAAIKGRVVLTGDPGGLEGVTVHLDRAYPSHWGSVSQRVGSAVSAADGSFSFGSLDPRVPHTLTPEPTDGLVRVESVAVPLSSGATATAEVRMSTPGRITGRVYDASAGKWLAGITVDVWPGVSGSGPLFTTVTQADGSYVVDGLLTGTYRVAFTDPEGVDGPYGQLWAGGSEYGWETPVQVTVGEDTSAVDASFVDLRSPVTTTTITAAWRKGPATVAFGARDQGWMGVARTWVKMPGASDYIEYEGPFTFATEGQHSFSYYSEDNTAQDGSHNAETPLTATLRIDDTPPTTSIHGRVAADTVLPQVIQLSTADNLSGVHSTRWTVDGREGSGQVVVLGEPGDHYIEYWSVDVAGNRETTRTATVRVADGVAVPPLPNAPPSGARYRVDPSWPSGTDPISFYLRPTSAAFDRRTDLLYLGNREYGKVRRYRWDGVELPSVHDASAQWHNGLGVDSTGRLFVVEDNRVEAFTASGTKLWTSSAPSSTHVKCGDVSRDGTVWLFEDYTSNWITTVAGPGNWTRRLVDYVATDLTVGDGVVYVADFEGRKIHVLSSAGAEVRSWATPEKPSALEVDEDGYVYVGMPSAVRKYTTAGVEIDFFPAADIRRIAVDAASNACVVEKYGLVRRYVHTLIPRAVSVQQPPQPLRPGVPFTVRGTASPAIAGLTVVVQTSADGGLTWREVGRTQTSADGTWSRNIASEEPETLRALLPGDRTFSASASNPVEVRFSAEESIAGTDRYGTAVAASQKAFPDGAPVVVIATGANWPDALGGAALAAAHEGSILLTKTGELPGPVLAEIRRLGASDAIVLGSTAAVGEPVAAALRAELGAGHVRRIGGADRYATAELVARETVRALGEDFDGTCFVATGASFPDALGASPIAAAKGWPLLLAGPKGLSSSAKSTVTELRVEKVLILGGESAVSGSVAESLASYAPERLAGANRYETAARVAELGVSRCGLSWDGVAIATGENFPDALAGGVLQGKQNSVMLLTTSKELHPSAAARLRSARPVVCLVRYLGGTAALGVGVRSEVLALLR